MCMWGWVDGWVGVVWVGWVRNGVRGMMRGLSSEDVSDTDLKKKKEEDFCLVYMFYECCKFRTFWIFF